MESARNLGLTLAKVSFVLVFTIGAASVFADPLPEQSIRERANTQMLLERANAPIKNAEDLYTYRSLTPKSLSPLELLSPAAQQRFLASLKFNENGLVGMNYADLRAELTPAQIYKVLSLFGVQRVAATVAGAKTGPTEADSAVKITPDLIDDHPDYQCLGGHNCHAFSDYICMTGC